jgi:hypothetical protein
LPEVVIKVQINQGTVHIQQYGINLLPGEHGVPCPTLLTMAI